MQLKHLIIFALIGMVALLGFNLINGSTSTTTSELAVSVPDAEASHSTDLANKSLGEQPKAILDDATAKIEQVQQVDKARLEKMNNEP